MVCNLLQINVLKRCLWYFSVMSLKQKVKHIWQCIVENNGNSNSLTILAFQKSIHPTTIAQVKSARLVRAQGRAIAAELRKDAD